LKIVGSGAMTSAFSSFRVATENAEFGMAEVAIGSFADAGANFILPRMDRNVGIYLSLTGVMLKAEDLL
jgi:enoyl-CoA hydratase/carnithine racemase